MAYGETIDGRLEFTAQDGTGDSYVDELEEYSFTRPAEVDCDAIAEPASAAPSPSTGPTTAAGRAASTSDDPAQPVTAGDTITLEAAALGQPLTAEAAAGVAADVVPPAAAALALVATVAGLLSVAGRRRVAGQPIGSV